MKKIWFDNFLQLYILPYTKITSNLSYLLDFLCVIFVKLSCQFEQIAGILASLVTKKREEIHGTNTVGVKKITK